MGKIKYLGFSFHGTPNCLVNLLKHSCWDFVQIQLNYYDWYQGTAKQQYEILRENGIPIMVMEPVHGGMLANLPEECLQLLEKQSGSPATWALRFVMNLPGVTVVLSGMSDMRQTEENVNTAACIGCGNCTAHCPQALDIPLYMKEMANLLK